MRRILSAQQCSKKRMDILQKTRKKNLAAAAEIQRPGNRGRQRDSPLTTLFLHNLFLVSRSIPQVTKFMTFYYTFSLKSHWANMCQVACVVGEGQKWVGQKRRNLGSGVEHFVVVFMSVCVCEYIYIYPSDQNEDQMRYCQRRKMLPFERLSVKGRWSCFKCSTLFHVHTYNPLKNEE